MTEFWVSNSKHWCDACKCWMSDTVNARAAHERGIGHKTNVQRKLRDMRKKAESEKKEAERTLSTLAHMEKAADKAYAKDLEAQAAEAPPLPAPTAAPPQFGSWGPQEGSAYLYNSALRWYYDTATGFYYGGDPPTWSKDPDIPAGARYEALNKAAGATGQVKKRVVRAVAAHPASLIGGYIAPTSGTVIGRSGGDIEVEDDTSKKGSKKRAREAAAAGVATGGPPMSDKQKAEMSAREAARERVAKRTAAAFGLK